MSEGAQRMTLDLSNYAEASYGLPKADLIREEARILQHLSDVLDEWLGPDAAPEERSALYIAMVEADPDFAAEAWRLLDLGDHNSDSIMNRFGQSEPEGEGESDT